MSEMMQIQAESEPYEVFSSPIGMKHDVYISSLIEAPHKYIKLIHMIRNMSRNDCCNIILNSPGGYITAGIQLIAAMIETQGHVHTFVEGEASSMASLIFMAGHQMTISKHSIVLFHNASWGFGGKAHEVMAHTTANSAWYDAMIRDLAIPFLNTNEVDKILSGLELYMTTEETCSRFSRIGEVQSDGATVIKHSTLELWDPSYVRPSIDGVQRKSRKKKA